LPKETAQIKRTRVQEANPQSKNLIMLEEDMLQAKQMAKSFKVLSYGEAGELEPGTSSHQK